MTETAEQVQTPAPDANVNPESVIEADADATPTENEAAPSVAAKEPGDSSDVTEKVRSRFDELTQYRRNAERERDYWREQALRRPPEPEKPAPVAEVKAKTLADFEFDEAKYQTYLYEQVEQRATSAAERKLNESQAKIEAERRAQTFRQREAEFSKTTPDYAQVAHFAPIGPAMAQALMALEAGPQLAYHLGKNPEIALRLNELPPTVAAFELGEINARLKAEREKAKASTVSKAPPPPPKIEGAGDPAVQKDPSQMTDAEFAKWRRRQIAQRR